MCRSLGNLVKVQNLPQEVRCGPWDCVVLLSSLGLRATCWEARLSRWPHSTFSGRQCFLNYQLIWVLSLCLPHMDCSSWEPSISAQQCVCHKFVLCRFRLPVVWVCFCVCLCPDGLDPPQNRDCIQATFVSSAWSTVAMMVNFYWTVLTLSRQVLFLPCDMYEGWFKLFFERYHSFPPFRDYKWQHLYLPYAWSNTYSWEKLNAIITIKTHHKLLNRILDITIIIIIIIIPNIYILKTKLHRLLKYYGRSWVSKNRILWQVY